MRFRAVALALAIGAVVASAQTTSSQVKCPVTGDAKNPSGQALATLMNRATVPTARDVDPAITFIALQEAGPDATRWSSTKAVHLTAWVRTVVEAPPSAAHCHARDSTARDIRLQLVVAPGVQQDPGRIVLAEITPAAIQRALKTNIDVWTTQTLKRRLEHQWIGLDGWLLYNVDPVQPARNSGAPKGTYTRATAWEIFPLTSFQVLNGPPRPG
jgi:hypothetical protein